MKQIKKTSLLDNDSFTKVFSVCLAFLCWAVVAMMNVSDYTKVVDNVPVEVTPQQSAALAKLNLSIIDIATDTVSVEVTGERGAVNNLKPEDLIASVQIPNDLTEPNVYDLKLILTNPSDSYRVEAYSPKQVRVTIDSLEDKIVDVTPVVTGAAAPKGYIIEEAVVSPDRLVVTGPKSEIDQVAQCVVKLDVNQEISKNLVEERPITLLDKQGEEINLKQHHLTLSRDTAQVIVNVLKEAELPVNIKITHVPNNFPIEELDYSMSTYELSVAGPVDIIGRLNELIVGVVDLRSLSTENNQFTFDIEMPASTIINLKNIREVRVTFPLTDWANAYFNVSDIELVNAPTRYNIKLLTESLPSVLITGTGEVLESITLPDIVAQIDLSQRTLSPGQYKLPVDIYVPGRGLVWAVGEYSAIVEVSEIA